MGTESPKRNAFALGFSLPLASFFRVTETKTLFGLGFGPPLATAYKDLVFLSQIKMLVKQNGRNLLVSTVEYVQLMLPVPVYDTDVWCYVEGQYYSCAGKTYH